MSIVIWSPVNMAQLEIEDLPLEAIAASLPGGPLTSTGVKRHLPLNALEGVVAEDMRPCLVL